MWFLAPPVTLESTAERDPVAAALGLAPDDIATETPIQQAVAGTSATIVRASTRWAAAASTSRASQP